MTSCSKIPTLLRNFLPVLKVQEAGSKFLGDAQTLLADAGQHIQADCNLHGHQRISKLTI
jgi:hypothetical protein